MTFHEQGLIVTSVLLNTRARETVLWKILHITNQTGQQIYKTFTFRLEF